MSQNDFNIANQGFPATRADINSALQALASTSAGATAPSTTYAYQMWYDETADLLKMRNSDNDAWITLAAFDQTADEWELRSAVIQAVDSAGVVIKTDDGTTRVTVADNGNVTLANDLVVTGTVQASNISATGSMAARNKIINGAMVIDQRNAGASVTPSTLYNTYTLDRWNTIYSVGSKFSVQQNAGSVTPPVGFKNYLGATSLSAYTPSVETFSISQAIEGYNIADLGWGAAGAKTITLSFWVRSSLTGTFGGALQNNGTTRCYAFSYTISAADTWEYKTIVVSGDTSGTWLTTNGNGLTVLFSLGSGATYLGTAGSWAAAAYYGATGQTNLVATSGATFYITGVQLEAGDTATPFEHRSYGQELALCQRYYYLWKNNSGGTRFPFILQSYNTSSAFGPLLHFPVEMRAAPTATAIGSYYPNLSNGSPATDFSSLGNLVSTPQSLSTGGWQGSASLTAGNATVVAANTGTTISLSAEL